VTEAKKPDAPAGAMAISANDPFSNPYGGLLSPRDAVLLSRGGGRGAQAYRVYEEIERDPRAFAVLQKRRQAVVARDWRVEPGGEGRAAKKAVALVEAALSRVDFDGLCLSLSDALMKGFAAVEVIWEATTEGVFPAEFRPIEQRRIVFDEEWKPRLLTKAQPVYGEELPDRKIIVHRFGSSVDPYGRGLGHQLFWACFFKRQSQAFWVSFAERFGQPIPVGKTPAGTPEAQRQALLNTLAGLARDSAVVVDDNQSVTFLEKALSGTPTYEGLVRYCDEEITIATLGETLTTSVGDVGSLAASKTHDGVRMELVDADCDNQSATINGTLTRWIVDFNMPGAPYPTVWRPRPARQEDIDAAERRRAEARAAQAAAAVALKAAGYAPEDAGADLTDQIAGSWRTSTPIKAAAAPAFAAPPASDAPQDEDDKMTAALDAAAALFWDRTIDGLRAMIEAAPSLEAAADGMTAFAASLDPGELAELLESGLLAAALGGAYEVDKPEGGA
jgi:phage gp29-like protein